jgi:hypothetical protein
VPHVATAGRTARVGEFQSECMNLTKRLVVLAGVCAAAGCMTGTASAAAGDPNELVARSQAVYTYFCDDNHDAKFYSDWLDVQRMSPMKYQDGVDIYRDALYVMLAANYPKESAIGVSSYALDDETHKVLCTDNGMTSFVAVLKSYKEKYAIGMDPAYSTEASLSAFAEKKLKALETAVAAEEARRG